MSYVCYLAEFCHSYQIFQWKNLHDISLGISLGSTTHSFQCFLFLFFRNHFNVSNVGKIVDISLEIVDVLSSGVYIN